MPLMIHATTLALLLWSMPAFAASLPDPLEDDHGGKIGTPAQWMARRQSIKQTLEHYEFGHAPPPPGNLTSETWWSLRVLDGKATYELVRLTFGPRESLHLLTALYVPQDGQPTHRAIVLPAFGPTPGAGLPLFPAKNASIVTPEEGAAAVAATLARGYAVLTFCYQDCGADAASYSTSGFAAAYPEADWGAEAVWAWGVSRAVDFLETRDDVDKQRIIAVGHSRLGKCVLIATAFDDRIALGVPAGSGCGGTAAFRLTGKDRGGKEGLEDVVKHFPFWFHPNLADFAGQVEKLPFDQHWLIALCAPRPLLSEEALDDPFVNGDAVRASIEGAAPVYKLLGASDRLAIHFRPGGHHLGPDDWQIILDFADKQLGPAPGAKH